MRRPFCTALFFVLLAAAVHAQEVPEYSKEFAFTTDNDAYLFRKDDAYYTNGFLFSLRKAKGKYGRKMVRDWELVQKIYTPLFRRTTGAADIDRPYCGYLALNFSQTYFSKSKDDVFRVGASLAQLGPASLGEEVQNGYHSLLGYLRFQGWRFQVQNAMGVDVNALYAATLLQDSNWIKLVPVAKASLGMQYTNAGIGSVICIGAFENNRNSALWHARTQYERVRTRRKYECYFFIHPDLMWQGYNATVQGGLFSKGSGAVLGDPERWMYQYTLGFLYAEERWTIQLAFVHQSEETTRQIRPQQYGSAMLSYRFR